MEKDDINETVNANRAAAEEFMAQSGIPAPLADRGDAPLIDLGASEAVRFPARDDEPEDDDGPEVVEPPEDLDPPEDHGNPAATPVQDMRSQVGEEIAEAAKVEPEPEPEPEPPELPTTADGEPATRLRCERYPELTVVMEGRGLIKFTDGCYVTEDPDEIEFLGRIPEVFIDGPA